MEDRTKQIEDFFDRYASGFNSALQGGNVDVEKTTECFANCFIEASPAGIICGQNDERFKAAIPKGYDFYKHIGIASMEIISKELTLFDSLHSMVKIGWRSNYNRKDHSTGSIDFYNIYFVQSKEDQHKIFGYITGDEQAALKEHGLI